MNTTRKGAVAWMTDNPVAANLILLVCLVGGLIMASQIKQEVFPEFETDLVTVTVAYPGASPEEVEKGIVLAIEERVSGLDGVKKVTSSSIEGVGTVTVEALTGADLQRLAQDMKRDRQDHQLSGRGGVAQGGHRHQPAADPVDHSPRRSRRTRAAGVGRDRAR